MRNLALLLVALAACKSGAAPAPPAAPVAAAPKPAEPQPAAAPRQLEPVATVEGVSEYQLDNGLRVLLFQDDSRAKVAVNVTYLVGSRHEGYGETGMAHLLEHMLFKGTPRYPDFDKIMQPTGAVHNASTSYDRTSYFELLPASDANLELALEVEADRMLNAKIAAEDLAKEFSVVRNEFERSENSPGAVLYERMMSTAYLWHNYGKSTIGSRADIERVPADALRRFYEKYYQPDNAVLIITGKLDPQRTLAMVQKHFGPLPRPTRKLMPTYTVEPVQDGERTVFLRRTGDVQVVGVMYHTVSGIDERFLALQAIGDLLDRKPTGRLYKALVEKGLATSVDAGAEPLADPGIFEITAEVPNGKPIEPVRDKIIQTVEGLGKTPPTTEEIDRYKANRKKQIELAMTNADTMSFLLSGAAALGDWRILFLSRDRMEKLTPAAALAAAEPFFKAQNRTLGVFTPTKQPDRAPLTERPDVTAMVKGYAGKAVATDAGEAFEATIDNIEKRTTRKTLPFGMKLALLPKETRGNVVLVQIGLHYGTEKELTGHDDASGAVGAMLMRGSKKHDFDQLKSEFDRLKAQVSMNSGDGDAVVTIRTVRANLIEVVGLVVEVLRQPAFPKDEFETMKKERLTGLDEQRSDPTALGALALERKLRPWPRTDIRYVPTIDEAIARLKATTIEDVKKVYGLWGASHSELTAVGDFDPAELEAAIVKGLGDWKNKSPYVRITDAAKPVTASTESIDTPDKESALLAVAQVMAVRDDNPDYAALWMTAYLLGNGFQSRLVDRLRTKEGWSYTASAGFSASAQDERATFRAFATVAPQNLAKAMAATVEEIGRMIKDPIPTEELARAQKAYANQFQNLLGSDEAVVSLLNRGLFLDRTLAWNAKVNAAVAALTPESIAAVLKKGYLDPAAMVKVTAGDMKKAAAPPAASGQSTGSRGSQ